MNCKKYLVIIFALHALAIQAQTDNSSREGYKADPAVNPVYNYYEWNNEIPANCPFERSDDILKVVFTGRYANYTGADTWYLQSAADGNLYSCWTDGSVNGFANNSCFRAVAVGHAKVSGSNPLNLKFENLGRLWAGGENYYPCVSLIVDGIFYIGTYYAYEDTGYFNGFRYSKNWDHFISNTEPEWKNEYWTSSISANGNFFNEKGKARFRVVHAVNFAKNNKAPDGMVYFTSHGFSSGSGWNDWNAGDAIYLCRTNANPKSITDAKSYEFFSGKDVSGKDIWKKNVSEARPVIDWPNHLGSEGITYLPALKKYILITCRVSGSEENNTTIFWESDNLTGPYKIIHIMKDWGPQTYFPNIPTQFIGQDGRSCWLCVSSNFLGIKKYNPHQCRYGASLHEITFVLKDGLLEHKLDQKNIAPGAKVWATSFEPDSKPETVIDGIVDTVFMDPKQEWISQEGGGAEIKLRWDKDVTIDRIRIYDSPSPDRWTQEGYFTFSDNSIEWMYATPSNCAKTPFEITFPKKTVRWVSFTITRGIADVTTTTPWEPGKRLGISEFQVFEAINK